jgi:hypothetical protein
MSKVQEVLILLDAVTQRWIKEAMDSFWRDGDGKIEPKDPWDEFEEEIWRQLKGGNPPQSQ